MTRASQVLDRIKAINEASTSYSAMMQIYKDNDPGSIFPHVTESKFNTIIDTKEYFAKYTKAIISTAKDGYQETGGGGAGFTLSKRDTLKIESKCESNGMTFSRREDSWVKEGFNSGQEALDFLLKVLS